MHNHLYQVKNLYAKWRYTFRFEQAGCAWKVCACNIKVRRGSVLLVLLDHTRGSSMPNQKYHELTLLLISTRLYPMIVLMLTMCVGGRGYNTGYQIETDVLGEILQSLKGPTVGVVIGI